MDFIELFEEGYGCGVLGSFIYGTGIGLVDFIGKTETSDMVIAVARFLAIILFIISFIQIIRKNCSSKKECITVLIKLLLSSYVINIINSIPMVIMELFCKTAINDVFITVSKFLTIILFIISFVHIIGKNCNSKKECITSLIKLFLSSYIIYTLISRLIGAIITFGVAYMIISLALSIVVVEIIIII